MAKSFGDTTHYGGACNVVRSTATVPIRDTRVGGDVDTIETSHALRERTEPATGPCEPMFTKRHSA